MAKMYFQRKNIGNFWETIADEKSMPPSCAGVRLSRICSRLAGWQEEAAGGRSKQLGILQARPARIQGYGCPCIVGFANWLWGQSGQHLRDWRSHADQLLKIPRLFGCEIPSSAHEESGKVRDSNVCESQEVPPGKV